MQICSQFGQREITLLEALLPAAGAPSPQPQKAPRDGATPQQIKCNEVAYLLYLFELLDPNITAQQAFDNYCANFDACYEE